MYWTNQLSPINTITKLYFNVLNPTIAFFVYFDNLRHQAMITCFVALSFIKTIFLTCNSLLKLLHFPLFGRVAKNSFFQQHQNSFTIGWTRHYLLRLHKSGPENTPDGGKPKFFFMINKFFVQSGASIPMSLMISTVNGLNLNQQNQKRFILQTVTLLLH